MQVMTFFSKVGQEQRLTIIHLLLLLALLRVQRGRGPHVKPGLADEAVQELGREDVIGQNVDLDAILIGLPLGDDDPLVGPAAEVHDGVGPPQEGQQALGHDLQQGPVSEVPAVRRVPADRTTIQSWKSEGWDGNQGEGQQWKGCDGDWVGLE